MTFMPSGYGGNSGRGTKISKQGPQIKLRKEIKKLHSLALSKEDIVFLLNKAGLPVPDDAAVVFRVPSGGCYAGEQVGVTVDDPVQVSWETKEEEG